MSSRSVAAVICGLTLTAAAVAQDQFVDTPAYKMFYLDGVPNFDQQRVTTVVPINGGFYQLNGLPGGGSEYCCPTSATEFMAFLANRGWAYLAPGPGAVFGNYLDGLEGLNEYNRVGRAISIMGDFMDTSASGGTGGGTGQVGSLFFLNTAYPGYFNTVNVQKDSFGFPTLTDMLNSSLAGNLCEIYGGWYRTVKYNGSTAYVRTGGHCVALTSVDWTGSPSMSFSIANPWTHDSKTAQSPQGYSPMTSTNATGLFVDLDSSGKVVSGSQETENVDFLDQQSGWILDGALEIQPYQGYTLKNGVLYDLNPIRLTNMADTGLSPSYKAFNSPDGTPIQGATRDPVTGQFFFFTQTADTIYVADPASGAITTYNTTFTPVQIAFGATLQPFVLTKNGTFALWDFKNRILTNSIELGNVSGIVYDHVNDSVYWYYWGGNGVNASFGQLAIPSGQTQFAKVSSHTLPILPKGQGRINVQIAGSDLVLFQSGDANLYEIFLAGNGTYVEQSLPAVQNATAFALDDAGRLYFSINGFLTVMDSSGNAISSPFSGLPAGTIMQMAHSVNNYKAWQHGTPAWINTVPDNAF